MEDGNEADREALSLEARIQAEPRPVSDPGWEWAIVEIFGHRRHAGRTREEERFGAKMLRVDVPIKGDPEANGWETHWYGGSSIFSYTLTDEDSVMRANKPYESPSRYRLPAPDYDDDYEPEREDVSIAAPILGNAATAGNRIDATVSAVVAGAIPILNMTSSETRPIMSDKLREPNPNYPDRELAPEERIYELKCPGVGRDKDCITALQFYFSRPVTDDEMRFLHAVVQRAVACARGR